VVSTLPSLAAATVDQKLGHRLLLDHRAGLELLRLALADGDSPWYGASFATTEEGKAHLSDNRAAVEGTLDHLSKIGERVKQFREHWEEAGRDHDRERGAPDRDMDDVPPEVNDARRELKHAIRQAARRGSAETKRLLAEILKRTADEIRALSGGDDVDI